MPDRSHSPAPCFDVSAQPRQDLKTNANRRYFVSRMAVSASVAVASLAVPLSLVAQIRLQKTKITLAVGGKSSLCHLPVTLADQLGFFRAEGLEVDISDVDSSSRVLQAVLSGGADIGADFYTQTLVMQAKNQILQAFVLQSRAPLTAFGVSTRALPGYQTLADLKGRKIGVSDADNATRMLAHQVLLRGGIQSGEVEFIEVGNAAGALAAMRGAQIDAISMTEPVITLLEQKSETKIISDTRTLKGTLDVFGGTMATACLYASQAFMQKNPAVCQSLTYAIVHALKWLQTAGPADLLKNVPENYLMGDRALYLGVFSKMREAFSPDGLVLEDSVRTALRALGRFNTSIRMDKIDLSKTYTNEFARRAKERFKV